MSGMSLASQAIVLLTAHFGPTGSSARSGPDSMSARVKPLSPAEWGRLAEWLRASGVGPERLLESDFEHFLASWRDPRETVEPARLRALLERSAAFGFWVEKWERAGLWILTRADEAYPQRLKTRLGASAPPLLFGCGPKEFLREAGVAVVGSRKANEHELEWAVALGAAVALRTLIVSGGARGVDSAALGGALGAGGRALAVLADSLLRATTRGEYREAILEGRLTLISPFAPEAGFDVGNAFARNKYIYCLSRVAVVVASAAESGGTRAGAEENLKRHWVPLYARMSDPFTEGNRQLIELGALPIEKPEDIVEILDRAGVLVDPACRPTGGGEGLVADSFGHPLPRSEDLPSDGDSEPAAGLDVSEPPLMGKTERPRGSRTSNTKPKATARRRPAKSTDSGQVELELGIDSPARSLVERRRKSSGPQAPEDSGRSPARKSDKPKQSARRTKRAAGRPRGPA